MVEKTAADYAKIFQSANLDREINSICLNVEDMLTRLDEFETLLSNVKGETNTIMEQHISGIVSFNENFQCLRERIDNLEPVVNIINNNLNMLEKTVDIAEQELHITDYSLKNLILKPLLAKARSVESAEQQQQKTNLKDGVYQRIPIFESDTYFGDSNATATTKQDQELTDESINTINTRT